jgi:hypothetical protein
MSFPEKVDSGIWESMTAFAELVDSFPRNVDFLNLYN